MKKRREVIAAAEATGEDVNEALRKAGLLDGSADEMAGDAVAGEDRSGMDGAEDGVMTAKKAKAKERIEKLKADAKARPDKVR